MNYEKLLNIPYKTYKIFISIIVIGLLILVIALNIEVYDVYNTYAIYKNDNLILNMPITYSDTIKNAKYLKIDDEKHEFHILYISEILLDTSSMTNYQEVVISSDLKLTTNTLVNISIYYNKEKVIEKIKKLF